MKGKRTVEKKTLLGSAFRSKNSSGGRGESRSGAAEENLEKKDRGGSEKKKISSFWKGYLKEG